MACYDTAAILRQEHIVERSRHSITRLGVVKEDVHFYAAPLGTNT